MEIQVNENKASVELSRGITGGYGWKVKCYNEDLTKAIATLELIDRQLKEKYGNNTFKK